MFAYSTEMRKADEPRSRTTYSGKAELVAALDEINADAGHAHLRLMVALADGDKAGIWINDGCRDMGEWVAARYGISRFKARKLVKTAHRLKELPAIRSALGSGALSLDKTIELSRFATPQDEEALLKWAKKVLPVTIRERADAANRPDIDKVREADRQRGMWWDRDAEADSLRYEGSLPSYEGSLLTKAVDEVAKTLAVSPEDPTDPDALRAAKRADALVLLAQAKLGELSGDEPLLVIEAGAESMASGDGVGGRVEDGTILHPVILNRLACDTRYETQATDGSTIVGLGRDRRFPDPTLRRAILKLFGHRCSFPGCEAKFCLQIHHSLFWERDEGPTDLYVMHPACGSHHKLPHEFGWGSRVTIDGVQWLRPDGSLYRPEPAQPAHPKPPPRSMDPEPLIRIALQAASETERIHPSVTTKVLTGRYRELAVFQ